VYKFSGNVLSIFWKQLRQWMALVCWQ